jgi:endonuclease III
VEDLPVGRSHRDLESKVNEHLDSIAASIPRLAEIVNDANALESRANAIGTAAKQIKEDIDNRLEEVLTLLHQVK